MIGMVLIGHGMVAHSLLAALEYILGPQTQITALGLHPGDDLEARRQAIRAAIARVDSGKGAVILTDMFGSTPSNLSAECLSEDLPVTVVTGMNLPMLVECAGVRRSENLQVTTARTVQAGQRYIQALDKPENKPTK